MISHPPSSCGACLTFSREKDSAIPFPRRPLSRILYTNDLIVLHLLGILFYFIVRKSPCYRDSNTRPDVSEGYEVISELPGRPAWANSKKNLNASKPLVSHIQRIGC